MKKKLSLLMVALVTVAAFAGLRRADAVEETLTLNTAAGYAELTVTKPGTSSTGGDMEFSKNDIVVTSETGYIKDHEMNIYKNGSMTIALAKGVDAHITKVELTVKNYHFAKPEGWTSVYTNDVPDKFQSDETETFTAPDNQQTSLTVSNASSGKTVVKVIKVTYVANSGEDPEPSTEKTVYFENDGNWAEVWVWAWNDTENFTGGEWPGVKIEPVAGKYSWSTTGDPTKIIFSNGAGSKTADLDFEDGATYNSKGKVVPEPELKDFSVTFTTDAGWENVFAYAWNEDNTPLAEWPGVDITATKNGEGVYTYAFKAATAPTGIIFNNGLNDDAKQQTADLLFENGKAYSYSTPKDVTTLDFTTVDVASVPAGYVGEYGNLDNYTIADATQGVKMLIKNNEAATRSRFWNNSGALQLRIYNGATLTFEPIEEGKVIKKITFDAPNWGTENSTDVETLTEKEWAGEAAKVVLTIAGGKTFINKITVEVGDATAPVEQTFTATFKTDRGWEKVYAYTWSGEGDSKVEQLGAWPGTEMTPADGDINNGFGITFKSATAPEKIIFNNGTAAEVKQQTADLDFVDGKTYNIINNIETLNAQEDKAEFDFAGEALIVAKPTAKYVYIKDETGASLIYDASGEKTAAAEVGKTLAANWAGAVSIYNGLFEAVPAAALAVKDGEPVEVTYPEATAVDVKAENVNQVVTIKGLTVTPGTGKNITFKLGEQEIAGYNQFDLNLTEISAEKTYDVVGAISRFKETIQFQPITIKEVTPEPAQGLIPNGTYYVMNAGVGTLINAEGKVDAKGAPISFTYNGETYTIAGADFFAEKQWTIAEAVEGMSGYYYISTEVEGQKAYLSVAENALSPVTTPDENCVWIVLQQSYWEDIVNSTYTVAGTKNLTGTENDWDIVEANKMTYNEETKLFEMTYKKITVNNDTKPEFKVVKQPMEGAAVWYPEGDNWVITPDVVGGEGIFDITITFDPSDLKEIKVSALQYADIEISPAEGDIAAALAEASAGKIAENITINLAANGAYTISAPIVPSAGFVINGNGATIDASGLNDAFIKMDKNPNVEKVESGQYVVKTASKIDGVKITGLTKGLYADNGTAYTFENFTINNSVFQYKTQSTIVLNFASSMAINFNITNSTFFSLEAGSANFIALSGKRPWQITGYADVDGKLTVDHNTFYNVAKAKQFLNTNTLKGQNKYKYEMNSNIFVDVSNKKIYGNMTNNTVQVTTDGKNTYMWEGTFFAETNYNGDEGLQTDPGFKDAANGDFTIGASTAQAKEKTGDPRWIVPQLYIIGDMNGWDRTAMTEMTFNAETQAFEYEYAPTTAVKLSFSDKLMSSEEAAADENWSVFNTTRYNLGEGNKEATLNEAMNLVKGFDGNITLKPVKEGTSYKISVAKDLSAVTISGEAAPEAPAKYYLVGSMTNWDVNADYELTPDNETEGQFKITKDFAANDAFKIVKGNKEAWYPDGMGNDYKITEAGNYTVYFNPAGGVEGWYEGFFNVVDNTSTGISAVKNAAALKDAQIYTISGQRVEKAQKGLYIVNGKKVVVK